MSWDEWERILGQARTIAVVGLSSDPGRASNSVAAYLQDAGYRVIPVNPALTEVLGEPAFPTLADVPEDIDLVDVFRRSEHTPPVAEAAVAVGAKALWLQQGIRSVEARRIADSRYLKHSCVRCAKYRQVLFGWLHGLVGRLTGGLDLYDAIRRPEARQRPMGPRRRLAALAGAVLLAPGAAVMAGVEVLLRRGGTVYVEARRA